MSDFAKDSESIIDLKKATVTKIRDLQTRWSTMLAWATKRTVFLNTAIANWQEFRQLQEGASAFIESKEKDLQGLEETVYPESEDITKEKVDQLKVGIYTCSCRTQAYSTTMCSCLVPWGYSRKIKATFHYDFEAC